MQFGFEGEIGYELSRYGTGMGPPDIDQWTLVVAGQSATVFPGPPNDPAIVLRCSMATFIRMVAGVIEPLVAVFERDLKVEGDLLSAAASAKCSAASPPSAPSTPSPPKSQGEVSVLDREKPRLSTDTWLGLVRREAAAAVF